MGLIVGGTWIGVRACGVEISLGAILVMFPLMILGVALPTPAGAGGYHAAVIFGLSRLFAVDESLAVSVSILSHFASILPLLLLGSIVFAVSNVQLRDLRALIARDDKSA